MNQNTCEVCLTNKTPLSCDLCKKASCKQCSIFMDEDCFELFEMLPEDLQHKTFCPQCYNEKIADRMADYEDILARAKDMDTYSVVQGSETRFIKRIEKPIRVEACDDQKEALLRLAFIAAEKGFDALVDVDIKSSKSGNKSYIKKIWSGTAIPIKR